MMEVEQNENPFTHISYSLLRNFLMGKCEAFIPLFSHRHLLVFLELKLRNLVTLLPL